VPSQARLFRGLFGENGNLSIDDGLGGKRWWVTPTSVGHSRRASDDIESCTFRACVRYAWISRRVLCGKRGKRNRLISANVSAAVGSTPEGSMTAPSGVQHQPEDLLKFGYKLIHGLRAQISGLPRIVLS
jgi:hypothetical protein